MVTYIDGLETRHSIGFMYGNADAVIERMENNGWTKYRVVARRIMYRRLYKFITPTGLGRRHMIRFLFDLACYDEVFVNFDHEQEVIYVTIVSSEELDYFVGSFFE